METSPLNDAKQIMFSPALAESIALTNEEYTAAGMKIGLQEPKQHAQRM